ncbi:phage tail assembly protein [Vibrio sp. JC009]|uniref:phage tail assembly protein n=1 Tax=Vibrio sp. JC009 TaxID=2912314 RepID=UPI0023B18DE9|nr:phage tail assembly protein [Vibrio sp. JC009]WED23085.1 phage tail assembly protein [Vibrio sp. JC009]
MKQTSLLRFYSSDAQKSQELDAEIKSLRQELKQITNETPESEIANLQKQIDTLQAEADELKTVKLKTISVAQFKALPFIKLDQTTDAQEFAQREALIFACSDISEEKFATLSAPDFIQLYEDIRDLILKPSDEIDREKLGGNDFEFDLLHPFTNEVQEKVSHIKFKVPGVIHSRELANIDDPEEREDFMFRVVTNLQKEDFNYLSINDYLALKPQVGAFFQQSAGYFRQ